MRKEKFLITPFIGAMIIAAIIIYGSITPQTGGKGLLDMLGFNFKHSDKLLHAGFYFLLAAAMYYGFIRQQIAISKRIIHSYSILIPILLGGAIELIQWNMIQTRHGEWADMIVNILGIFLAYLGYRIYKHFFQKKQAEIY
jgi:glycopeptide antibiotics resistance protein